MVLVQRAATRRVPLLVAAVVWSSASCHGAGAEPAATTVAATTSAAPTAVAAFSTMTKEQRLQHMKTVIQPTMGKLFADFDAKKYGDFGCSGCHGDKREDTHKVLPKLKLSGDGGEKLAAERPAIMKFMREKVTPTMARAMGEKQFDSATFQGFGCRGCHAVE